jgi:tetratricopeptide (TPR) repeat protein/predicted Ser/Thr protein kinase
MASSSELTTRLLAQLAVGPYKIESRLGAGGMGEVYLAQDTRLARKVAIKLLPAVLRSSERARERFIREAQAAAQLDHPNICPIYEIERDQEVIFIVMQYVEGETLASRLRRDPLTLGEALDIAAQVADALTEAHSRGVIHRDIKPQNLMITPHGRVKVLDFGLAKIVQDSQRGESATETNVSLTDDGVVVGTAAYMSPEQARCVPVDQRSDLFSLAVMLYECVTGRRPFVGPTRIDIHAQVIHFHPPPPSHHNPRLPPELDRVILKALAKNPEDRYESCGELLRDLRKMRQGLSAEDASVTPGSTLAAAGGETDGRGRATGAIGFSSRLGKALSTLSETVRRPRAPIYAVLLIVAASLLVALAVYRWNGATPHRPSTEAANWYDRGAAELRDGAYFQASKAFERSIQIDDRYALAHARLGEAWSELDYTDKAKNELLRANALVPDRSTLAPLDALYLQGVTDTLSRNFAGAVENYRKISEQISDKDKKYAYVDLGRAYEKNEEINNAIAAYEQAAKLDSEYPTPFLRLGVLYGRQQALKKADEAFHKAETLYQALSNSEGVAEVLYQRGYLLNYLDRLSEAHSPLEKAVETARANQNIYQHVRAQLQLTSVLAAEGNTVQAEQYAKDAIELARRNGLEEQTTSGLTDLGTAFFLRGDYNEAEKYFNQALEKARRYGQRANEAMALLSLGSLRIQQQNPDEASQYVEQALGFYQQAGYGKQTAVANSLLGRAYRQKGDYEAALRAFKLQLGLAQEVGDQSQIARAYGEIGNVSLTQEQYADALNSYDQSYQLKKALNIIDGYELLGRAEALWRLGRYPEAGTALNEASPISNRSGDKQLSAAIHQIRAEMALSQLSFQEAKVEAQKSLEIAAAAPYPPIAVIARSALGLAQTRSGSMRQGRLLCEEAAVQAKGLGDPWLISETLLALAEAMLESGDARQGLENALRAQDRVARLGQRESEWRAWLIAARASRKADEQSAASEYAAYTDGALSRLEQQWGSSAYNDYLTRPDVKQFRKQLSQVLDSSK